MPEKKRFSLVARAKSFTHAFRGLVIFIRTTHNAWVHLFVGVVVVILGWVLCISHVEWMIIVLVIGLVLVSEAFNTAIEIDIDLTSPDFHPYARDTKDVAAGAVLVSTITAIVVGMIIFIPNIIILI
ncbi:MAG: diacylglycerol kinase family protein [Oligoflexales bacterium]|nr:diacylglycerol kinase family protein [Oligoflexales bacterium]